MKTQYPTHSALTRLMLQLLVHTGTDPVCTYQRGSKLYLE